VRVCRADKQAVVFRRSPVLPCLPGQQFFYPFPRLVAYIVPVNAFIFFHASYFTSFPFFNLRCLACATLEQTCSTAGIAMPTVAIAYSTVK
jgi:hypothetical protein